MASGPTTTDRLPAARPALHRVPPHSSTPFPGTCSSTPEAKASGAFSLGQDAHCRPRAQVLQQARQMRARQGDAALRGGVAQFRHVHENCAAAAARAGALVVIQHDEEVVERIFAPKSLGAGRIGKTHGTIVVAVGRGIAPAVPPANGSDRQRRAGAKQAVRSIENRTYAPLADGRRAVALAFAGRAPRPSECAGKALTAKAQRTARATEREGFHGYRDWSGNRAPDLLNC